MEKPKVIEELFAPYAADVDRELRQLFAELPDYEMYQHLAYFMGFSNEYFEPETTYGGKRFRSSMALMLGECYGAREATLPAALSLELFHNFTLIHDDIVDNDEYRRGRKTVWKLWGVPHAINDGDAQALLAYGVLARGAISGEVALRLLRFLTERYRKVAEGQFLDFTLTALPLGHERVTEASYYEMVGRKTADLIAAATGVAGIAAGVEEREQDALLAFGYNLGVAYQLCDDLISIWEDAAVTGKQPHNDVYEKKKTLPVLFAWEKLSRNGRAELERHLNSTVPLTASDVAACIALLEEVGTYPAMRARVLEHADAAKQAARALSLPTGARETLVSIVDALLPAVKNG